MDRGLRVAESLLEEGLVRAKELRFPQVASWEDLRAVHTQGYLESVTSGTTLQRIYGLGPDDALPSEEVFHSQRAQVGGTIEAALSVMRKESPIAVNLGGGFHHAFPDQGGALCVLNDVAAAIARLRQEVIANGTRLRFAIVDLDFHEGNGNFRFFANDPEVFLFSYPGHTLGPEAAKLHPDRSRVRVWPTGSQDSEYLAALREELPRALERFRPDLIFYLAGTDGLAGDPLGDLSLSLDGLLERDQFVIEEARRLGAGLVVTLAGGYTDGAREAVLRMARWIFHGFAERAEPGWAVRRRIRRMIERVGSLRPGKRVAESPLDASEDPTGEPGSPGWSAGSLDEFLDGDRARRLFLGHLTRSGVELWLEQFGVLPRIRRQGYDSLRVEVETRDPEHERVRVFGRPLFPRLISRLEGVSGRKNPTERTLLELVVRRASVEQWVFLQVEWLLLQNPDASFSSHKPPLPGQRHPGLGVAVEVQHALVALCERLGLDGVGSFPSHFHSASVASEWAFFLDSRAQHQLRILQDRFRDLPLAEASQRMEREELGDFVGSLQVLPVSQAMKDYFLSSAYRSG